jgi:hypothetical protein
VTRAANALGVVRARQRARLSPPNLWGKNAPKFRRQSAQERDASDAAVARAFGRALRELVMCPLARCLPTQAVEVIRARNRYSEQGMRDIVWKNRRKAQRIARERHDLRAVA